VLSSLGLSSLLLMSSLVLSSLGLSGLELSSLGLSNLLPMSSLFPMSSFVVERYKMVGRLELELVGRFVQCRLVVNDGRLELQHGKSFVLGQYKMECKFVVGRVVVVRFDMIEFHMIEFVE